MNAPAAFRAVNQGVAPVTYGQGDRPPRGDYAQARADYTCEQDWAAYTAADHDLYRRLHERQSAQLPGLACDEFIAAVQHLGPPSQIPRFDALSEKLMRATGWEVVAVPGDPDDQRPEDDRRHHRLDHPQEDGAQRLELGGEPGRELAQDDAGHHADEDPPGEREPAHPVEHAQRPWATASAPALASMVASTPV